jgi:hypothetical protein
MCSERLVFLNLRFYLHATNRSNGNANDNPPQSLGELNKYLDKYERLQPCRCICTFHIQICH